MTILEAIAREEGFYAAGSLAQRQNNPGNIEDGLFARSHGALARETIYSPDFATSDTPKMGGSNYVRESRFAVFPTAEVGFAAMKALLSGPLYSNLTVAEAIAKWAPETENDTARYISNVCQWCECQPTDMMSDLLNKEPANAVKR